MIIDSHLHVWDLDAGDYPWLGPEHGELYRTYAVHEAAAVLAGAGVSSAVLVQAEDSVAETERLLDVARAEPWVLGVVGWVPLDLPTAASDQLDRLDGPGLRGLRHLVHDDPRDDFFELRAVRHTLAEVAERGLVLDVPDAWPRHLDSVTALADAVPGLTIVVDHLAKPPRGQDLTAWERSLREVADRPQVVAKLSGLQVPGQPLTTDAVRHVVDVALDAFSPDRLMFGGDWPMTVPHGGYLRTLDVLRPLVDALAEGERDAIWHGTATRIYGRSQR